MTSKELADVDVGSWFNRAHPALARADYEKQRIPTLEEVFQFAYDRQGVIYIELKTEDTRSVSDLVRSVVDSIRKVGFEDRVVVVSFDLTVVAETKSLNSSIRTGALFSPRRGHALNWRADTILKATSDCGADEILLHRLLARSKLIERATTKICPWWFGRWTIQRGSVVPRPSASTR